MAAIVEEGKTLPVAVYLDDPTVVIPGAVIEECARVFRIHAPCPDGRVAQITSEVVAAFVKHPDSRFSAGLHEQIEAQADEISTLLSCVEELRAENERLSILKNQLAVDNQNLKLDAARKASVDHPF